MAQRQKEMAASAVPVRAVTFDVGHTLLTPRPSVGGVYARVAARHGLRLEPADAEARFFAAWLAARRDHAGLVYGTDHRSACVYWRRVLTLMFADAPLEPRLVEALLADLYAAFDETESWAVMPGLDAVLAALARGGIRVGLVSNWDVRLRGLLRRLELERRFEAVIISAECAVEKPDAGIFRAALARLGVPPAACLHLGDTWHEDVVGAAAAGMRPVWFNPHGRLRPAPSPACPEIRSLPGLLSLLA